MKRFLQSADETDTLNIHRRLGGAQSIERTVFNSRSPSSTHPFYVLDDFIDVGLIDLNLLPGNTQSVRQEFEFELHSCVVQWMNVGVCVCVCGSYSSARCFSLVFAWLIFSVLLRSICLFSSFFSL